MSAKSSSGANTKPKNGALLEQEEDEKVEEEGEKREKHTKETKKKDEE
jgi:hypothetical protein